MNERLESLDGIRALAAIGIVASHVLGNLQLDLPRNFLFDVLIPFGANYVFLFMIISALSMCCGYYQKFKDRQVDLNTFYKRRYSRIWPFFALLVLIDLVVSFSSSSAIEAFADLTLLFGFLPNPDIQVIGMGWFLGLIFVFYTIFPFFVFIINDKKRAWFSFVVSIAMCVFASSYFSRPELVVRAVGKWNILYSMPMFVCGGILFLYLKDLKKLSSRWQIPLVLAVLASILFFCTGQQNSFAKLALFAFWVVFAIADSGRGAKWTLLNNKIMAYISGISMEIYLCHMMIFRAVEKTNILNGVSSGVVRYILYFVVTLIGATVFSHVVKMNLFPLLAKVKERIIK